MSSDAKLMLKRATRQERWEMQERGDYDLERFGEEFRNRLYSERGRDLARQQTSGGSRQKESDAAPVQFSVRRD